MKKTFATLAGAIFMAATLISNPLTTSAAVTIPTKLVSPAPGTSVSLVNGQLKVVVSSPCAMNLTWFISGMPTVGPLPDYSSVELGTCTDCRLGEYSVGRSFTNTLFMNIPDGFRGGWTFNLVGCLYNPETFSYDPVVWTTGLHIDGIPAVKIKLDSGTNIFIGQKVMLKMSLSGVPNAHYVVWGFRIGPDELAEGMTGDFWPAEGYIGGTGETVIKSSTLPANLMPGTYLLNVLFDDGTEDVAGPYEVVPVVP